VFGGTFDPVHVGHLVAAVGARDALHLDRVLLVVANQPWQKHDRSVSPAEYRLAMLAAAVADVDGLEASAIEIERGGASYTVDTLEALSAAEPASDLFLVVGADVVADLPTWRRVGDVADLATLVVVTRPGPLPPIRVPVGSPNGSRSQASTCRRQSFGRGRQPGSLSTSWCRHRRSMSSGA